MIKIPVEAVKLPAPPLVRSEVLYRKLVEHMNEGVWMGDKNERTVYANPKFCQMMEYTLEEMMGRESYEFWDKESAERVRYVNSNHRKKGVSSSYEGNLLTKSGKKIPVLLSGTPLPDGGTIGIMADLSELKRKEQAEKVLGSALQYASDAIIICDQDGHITSWNKGAKIIFGFGKREMLGSTLDTLFPKGKINELWNEATSRSKRTSGLYKIEMTAVHKNQREIVISATMTPIFSGDNKGTLHWLLIARDITSKTKFEEELALKYQKMKEAYNRFGILRRQMDYMFDMLDLCSGAHDKKNIADVIVSSIIMLTRVDACILRKYNKNQDSLDLVSTFGVGDAWEGKARIRYENSLAQKAFEKKIPLKIIDLSKESRYHSVQLAKKHNLSSLLLIPLRFKSNFVGTLSLYTSPEKKLEIFENEFIEQYAKLVEVVVGTMLV